MPDYKQTTITGTSWQRAYRVECENPLDGHRAIVFHEELVVNAGDNVLRTPNGYLGVPFSEANAATQFDLLDPATGEAVGTATFAQVYQMLHSLYIHSALQRDAAQEQFAEQPETDDA